LLALPFAPYAILVALLVVWPAWPSTSRWSPAPPSSPAARRRPASATRPAFGATNFAWASGYALGASLGGLLADLGGDALSYLSLAAVCVLALLLWRTL
jgi:predicted MFS family arabinose efflux permease